MESIGKKVLGSLKHRIFVCSSLLLMIVNANQLSAYPAVLSTKLDDIIGEFAGDSF